MALALADFRVLYPEFRNVGDDVVSAKLAEALNEIGTLWGAKADRGQGLYAAHLLALAPPGQQARLTSEKADTTYGRQFRALREQVVCLIRTP